MHEPTDDERFRNALPWYVTGRLAAADRDWMENYLQQHPERQADVRLDHLLRKTLKKGEVAYDGKQGLPEFVQRMRAENYAQASTESLPQHMSQWLERFGLRSGSPAALAFALLLMFQVGLVSLWFSRDHLQGPPAEGQWRSAPNQGQAKTPVLSITFKPDTEERKVRLLLVQIRGTIVGGPGQLGNYLVQVPEDSLDTAQKQVAASAAVESVERLDQMPTSD